MEGKLTIFYGHGQNCKKYPLAMDKNAKYQN